eukprot:TRINITY_DN60648_c0_g1_i1.p1 TRINITY_DN60648_c0_g1~~TRINITY_DN60648_c0_g1_i1.p1  ORF type:complete len:391 (+),score=34.14 TRINITY_DN60648_c0_g1_i1:41-1213(+)
MSKQKVLILGGSGFMGIHITELLLSTNQFSVTLLNRGKQYWRNPLAKYSDQIAHLKCDRHKTEKFIACLQTQPRWDVVIDMCCYKRHEMEPTIQGLTGRVGVYIFITTDSVYEACRSLAHDGTPPEQAWKEEDSVRPSPSPDSEEYKALAKRDSYGHHKLVCEEMLLANPQFPAVRLRLPDVFGPYDQTDRFWTYLLWMKISHRSPIHLTEKARKQPLSFIYSTDVANVVLKVIQLWNSPNPQFPSVVGRAYNIPQRETPTLEQFLQCMAKAMTNANLQKHEIKFMDAENWDGYEEGDDWPSLSSSDSSQSTDSDSYDNIELLPSVTYGPINGTRAYTELDFKPTPMVDAVAATVDFFGSAWKKFPEERPELDEFQRTVRRVIREAAEEP